MKKVIIIMMICLSSLAFGSFSASGLSMFGGGEGSEFSSLVYVLGGESKMLKVTFDDSITEFDYLTLVIEDDNGDIYEFDDIQVSGKSFTIMEGLNRSKFSKLIKLFKKSNELEFFITNYGIEHSVKINCKGFTKAYNKITK